MLIVRHGLLAGLLLIAPLAQADTLHDIYELAVRNDPLLKVAEAEYRAKREALPLGRAGLLPWVSGSGEYSESEYKKTSSSPIVIGGTPIQSSSRRTTESESETWTVTLSQAIFDLPAWFAFKEGREISRQAEAELAAAQQDLMVRSADAYFNVLRAQDNLASSRAQELAFQRQLEQTRQRYDVGLIAITDVHEAQAAYDLALVTRLSDEGDLGIAYEALTVLTNQPHDNLWALKADFPITPPVPENRDEWVDFALNNNYDLKAAWYRSQASQQAANARKSAHLPTLRGGYRYSHEAIDGDIDDHYNLRRDPFDDNTRGDTVFLRLEMPLFSGGSVSAQRRQAWETYNASREGHTATQRNTIQQTRSLHLAVTTHAGRVQARRQALVSSQSALDATRAGYDVGTRNVVDVLQAERLRYQALRDYANSRYDYVLAQLRLKQLAGTLSPQDILDLTRWLEAPAAPTLSGQDSR